MSRHPLRDPFKPIELSQVFRKLINDDISCNYTPGNMSINVKGYEVKHSCPWLVVLVTIVNLVLRKLAHTTLTVE